MVVLFDQKQGLCASFKLWDNGLVSNYGLIQLEKDGYVNIFIEQKQDGIKAQSLID